MENLKELHTKELKNKQAAIRNTLKMIGTDADVTDLRMELTKKHHRISLELFLRIQAGTY